MVPPNWDHPKVERHGRIDFQPMRDQRFDDAAREWKEGFAKWEAGLRPEYHPDRWVPLAEWSSREIYGNAEWWEYDSMPPDDRAYYRPWTDVEATWFQVFETVSEGTPVTPPFATREELIDYLATHGDFWDQARKAEGRAEGGPWERANAEKFVNSGWAPSMMVTRTAAGVNIKMPRDM